MRKLLLFFAMCCASVLAQAAITITPANNIYVGATTYSGYGIYGAKEGELAQLLNETYTGTVQWNGATLEQLKSAVLIKVGSSSNPNVLGNADLEALELLSGARFLDIDGSQLAAGANISSIKAGPNIEAVTLPNQLTKEQVNAAGASLKACNSNFGSCMSLDAEMEEKEVTTYTFTDPCTSEKVEYTGEVTGTEGKYKGTIPTLTRDVTLISNNSTFSYENTKFPGDVVSLTVEQVRNADGTYKTTWTPESLKVALTQSDNPARKYYYKLSDGTLIEIPSNKLYSVNMETGYVNDENWGMNEVDSRIPNPLTAGTQLIVETEHNYTYTYTLWNGEYDGPTYTCPAENVKGGAGAYYCELANPGNHYSFPITANYAYSYSYVGTDCNVVTVENSPTYPGETIELEYNQTVDLTATTQTINVPKEGGNTTVVAYVNTPGTLYQATSLDNYDVEVADALIISGNINNADISVHANATDPSPSTDADAFTTTGATPAFYVNHKQCQFESIDMSDAVIDDYKHLRVLDSYGNKLETIVFPKSLEKIPNYCCYANGNSGLPNLKNVTFPENLKSIGNYAFSDTKLAELVLPGTIQSVGDYAFYTCKQLELVEMESLSGSCTFGEYVFASSAVKHVTLSEGVTGISAHMFDVCASLESVRIPTTASTIKTGAFAGCVSLHKLTIPDGVQLLEQSVFDGAGLTDIYVMASEASRVPKIYCLDPDGGGIGTFTKKNILGNNTSPTKTKGTDYDETTSMETALSWYQEEFSDMNFGLGGNNCMIQLHYPENMKSFYNGMDNLPSGWTGNLASTIDMDIFNYEIAKAQESGWLSTVYAYGSQEYDREMGGNKGNSCVTLGPTEDGLYWPIQEDYLIRLAAGYSSSGQPTAEAWRQIPLQGITDEVELVFTKEYDDTWYTMAFPWDMDDNTLFSAFNQKCEIVEFMGAEVLPGSTANEYNLIFHFDEVAKTRYMPEDHSAEYKRIDAETTRTVELTINGTKTTKKYYTYQNIENGELVYWPYDLTTDAGKAMQKKYNAIMHMMVFAGHPYMIHPAIGASAGNPTNCTIAGVKKAEVGTGIYESCTTLADLAEAEKVEKVVSADEYGATTKTEWTNPVTKKGGKYYFIGNINDEVDGDKGVQDMPTENGPVYFLGLKPGTDYPQYFKKAKGKGKGKWSQYSAIIVPDADAIANVEGLDGMSVGSSSGAAKGFDVAFGEWEVVESDQMTTIIDNAVAEGHEKNEPANIKHLNVVYNIKGQVVRDGSSSVEGLPKGLYIVNGKKYMVK